MRVNVMKKTDKYGSVLLVAVLVLFALMMGTVYKIKQQKAAEAENALASSTKIKIPAFIPPALAQKHDIVIIDSRASAQYFAKHGGSIEAYSARIKQFEAFIHDMGYTTTILPIEKLHEVSKQSVVFLLDAQVLSAQNKEEIKTFVKDGGALFFNFLAGFDDTSGKYVAEKFVKDITTLQLSSKGFGHFKTGLSATLKLLSPFSVYLKEGISMPIALYDEIPIYETKGQGADFFMSNYDQVQPPMIKDTNNQFTNTESALAWHGYLGKGKWVYTSLPSYSFYDIEKQRGAYQKMLAGMIDYLSSEVVVQAYPYIDQKSVIFISEDTEYKFSNFKRFTDLAKEYGIPVTTFLVANLATAPEHKEMLEEIKKNTYVEFASHSTTHKKIVGESEAFVLNETANSKKLIDPLAPKSIIGFRPPREELNKLMKKDLADAGFSYVLGASKSFLYPVLDKDDPRLYFIPRHGTDDYSYLVNLDWNQDEIVESIIKEANFVTQLNGIYTLSVHTHLFSYKSNINIIRSFYEYLKKHPELKPLQGAALIQRVKLAQNIELSSKMVQGELVITVKNNNAHAVKNLNIQLFKNPEHKVEDGRVSHDLEVTYKNFDNTIVVENIPGNTTANIYISFKK
jgi:peptidoglycan/xylan/chitin deacetylase (PgdA/CDA1 family)